MDSLKKNQPNIGKNLVIDVNGEKWARLPIQTHIITKNDALFEVVDKYAKSYIIDKDYLFISERIVAISQGRAFHINDIRPSWLAKFLVRFVHKSPYGIGLGSPWTMELAIREAGAMRIILGALISGLLKPFGVRGIFYRIVGNNINAIDGPCSYTLPPYNEYAKLGPKDPAKVAKDLAKHYSEAKYIHKRIKFIYKKAKEGEKKEKLLRWIDLISNRKYHGTEVPKFVKSICRKHREDLFRFVDNPEVEPTNNLAERGLRHAVVMRKISGGSRSNRGAETTAKLLSALQTIKMQEGNVIENMVNLLQNTK